MSLEERIIGVVKKNTGKKCEITLESRLIEDLKVDSFDKLMIISGLEDEFSITIDEGDFQSLVKVSDIVDRLKQKYPMIEGK